MKKIFTIFLVFFSLMIEAQTTYYIDPAGNNGNSGSIDSPWLTLTYACANAITSGDIIHVNTGTYTETTQSVLAVGVSIEGAGVTSKIISNITTAYAGTLYLASGTEGTNGNQHISGIYFDGNNRTTYCAIWVRARSNVEIYNCTFINYDKYGVRFHGEIAGSSPSTSVIYATGNSVHDCVITNCAYYQHNIGGGADVFMSCQTGFDCYNNIITQSRPAYTNGCGVKTDGWTKGLQIHGNTITGQILSNKEVTDSWDFAIEMWGDFGSVTEGTHIYENNIYNWEIDISGRITQKGSYDYGCSIHDNFIGCINVPPVPKIGIWLEANTSLDYILIYHNHIKNVAKGIGLYATNQIPLPLFYNNITICYNLIDNCGYNTTGNDQARGIWWSQASGTTNTVNNLRIYNNVITARTGGIQEVGIQLGNQTGVIATNFEIKNNIITGFDDAVIYTGTSGTIDSLWIQNNIFYGNGQSNVPDLNIIPTHFTNSGNITTNPLFASTIDLHLTSGSPAINAGIQITSPSITTDYDSVTIGNPPDIGAYEFISNHSPSILDQGFQLSRNSQNGDSVGTVIASDQDAGQTLTYSIISGNTYGAFAINDSTGELSVSNSAALIADFEIVVKVKDNGIDKLSSQAIITINIIPTGIKFIEKNQGIKVYPNPVSDKLIIEIEGNKNNPSVEILNSMGQVVFEGNLSEKTIVQTSNFSPGIYLIKIENGRSFEFKKILKI
jgi:hypothetical protein